MDIEKLYRIYRGVEGAIQPSPEPTRIIYGDTPTFLQVPRAFAKEEFQEADAVFMGFPEEGWRPYAPRQLLPPDGAEAPPDSIYFRTGTTEAPRSVRDWGIHHSILHPRSSDEESCHFVDYDLNLGDYLNIMDYGDAECRHGDSGGNHQRAREMVRDIVAAGAIPLIQGGDHSTPIPGILGITDNTKEKIGIIGFDSHFDLNGIPAEGSPDSIPPRFKYTAASQYMRALETPNVEPENIVLIGMKGVHNSESWVRIAQALGIRYFTLREIDERGIESVMDEALERVLDGTRHLYVTLDIDVIDCAYCPGQRFPDTPGITPREIIKALRLIGQRHVIGGFDICCLAPQYDPQGATQLLAARCHLEVLGSIAAQFKKQGIRKWYRQPAEVTTAA